VKRSAVVLGLALLALGLLGVSSAANLPLAGNFDPSFGRGGIVKSAYIAGIAVQPDGKIVTAGTAGSSAGGPYFGVARYLPDGSPDPSFGDGGRVVTPFTYWGIPSAVALQPDGKIVVAGTSAQGDDYAASEFTLARYEANGALDTSFGTDGITNTVFPEPPGTFYNAEPTALAVLPDGDIVAGGSLSVGIDSSWSVLARYTPDGSLDPTFGDGGTVQSSSGTLAGIAVQPDGKIVASGSADVGGHGQDIQTMALTRFEPDGTFDGTFGYVTTDPRRHYEGGPLLLRHGKILVAGTTREKGSWFPVVARFDAGDHHLDSTFGKNGFAEIRRQLGTPTAILAHSDGKILIAENSTSDGLSTVVRLLPNGRLDRSFGREGIASITVDPVSSLALQTDGRVLVGGGILARLLGGTNCVVPILRGKTLSRAAVELRDSYCRRGRVSRRFSGKVIRGRVISAALRHGARLPDGSSVDLVVSKGTRP